ncbi:MAG: hypothetical protein SFW66_04280 [Gammaproteobacteria bacterium]|nr:hypothetical protein [Gammaproteobacteria bacterium]
MDTRTKTLEPFSGSRKLEIIQAAQSYDERNLKSLLAHTQFAQPKDQLNELINQYGNEYFFEKIIKSFPFTYDELISYFDDYLTPAQYNTEDRNWKNHHYEYPRFKSLEEYHYKKILKIFIIRLRDECHTSKKDFLKFLDKYLSHRNLNGEVILEFIKNLINPVKEKSFPLGSAVNRSEFFYSGKNNPYESNYFGLMRLMCDDGRETEALSLLKVIMEEGVLSRENLAFNLNALLSHSYFNKSPEIVNLLLANKVNFAPPQFSQRFFENLPAILKVFPGFLSKNSEGIVDPQLNKYIERFQLPISGIFSLVGKLFLLSLHDDAYLLLETALKDQPSSFNLFKRYFPVFIACGADDKILNLLESEFTGEEKITENLYDNLIKDNVLDNIIIVAEGPQGQRASALNWISQHVIIPSAGLQKFANDNHWIFLIFYMKNQKLSEADTNILAQSLAQAITANKPSRQWNTNIVKSAIEDLLISVDPPKQLLSISRQIINTIENKITPATRALLFSDHYNHAEGPRIPWNNIQSQAERKTLELIHQKIIDHPSIQDDEEIMQFLKKYDEARNNYQL